MTLATPQRTPPAKIFVINSDFLDRKIAKFDLFQGKDGNFYHTLDGNLVFVVNGEEKLQEI